MPHPAPASAGAGHLPLTGERTVPGIARENYWFRRHEVVYEAIAAQPWATGTIVEAGCGEGYGADMLRGRADQVIAVDYDAAVVAHVRQRYPRVDAVQGNLVEMPLADGSSDAVVSLQVLEHLWDTGAFLAECRRVLRPGGRLVVSTPNRLTFSPGIGRGEKPTNPFHIEEYDAGQLDTMLSGAGFTDVRVQGLRHGPHLSAWEARHGSIVQRQIEAVLSDTWPDELLSAVAAVTTGDFDFDASPGGLATCLDLLVTAVWAGPR